MTHILIYTKPKAEVDTNLRLIEKDFNSYLPMVYSDKKIEKNTSIEVMFPRYLFSHFIAGVDDISEIKNTKGVSNVVCFGGQPGYICDDLIEGIQSRHDENGIIDIWKDYEKGDEVRITSGTLKDYDAIFLCRNKNERVAILLSVSQKIVDLPKKYIEPKVV